MNGLQRFLAFVLLSTPIVCFAIERNECRNGLFPDHFEKVEQYSIAPEKDGKTYLRSDTKGCPEAANCIMKAYLVAGDTLLAYPADSQWACAWYFGKSREFVGYLPIRELRPFKSAPENIVGKWVETYNGPGDIKISIKKQSKTYHASGATIWQGLNSVNTGEIDDDLLPSHGYYVSSQPDNESWCSFKMRVVGRTLLVSDNGYCGGLNVSFTGVYKKVK